MEGDKNGHREDKSRWRAASELHNAEISDLMTMDTTSALESPPEADVVLQSSTSLLAGRSPALSLAEASALPQAVTCHHRHHLQVMRRSPMSPVGYAVPDIIVEHVPSTFAERGGSPLSWHAAAAAQFRHTLTPPFSSRAAASTQCLSEVGRQSRTLSDSLVYQLEKSILDSSTTRAKPRECMSESLDLSVHRASLVSSGTVDTTSTAQISMPISGNSSVSLTGMDRMRIAPAVIPFLLHLENMPLLQQPPASPRFAGPERSPKAYWLRRHSDSNLASDPCSSMGLRVEPYPIRSHSTGDTLVTSAALSVFNPRSPMAVSDRECSDEHLVSEPKVCCQGQDDSEGGRATSSVKQRSALGQKSSMETLSESIEQKQRQREVKEVKAQVDSAAGMSDSRSKPEGLIDTVTDSGHPGKPASVVDKRLKLKKYLQTRYQMSLHKTRHSSDTDEVFADRSMSPGPFTPPVKQPYEVSSADVVTSGGIRSRSDRSFEIYQQTSRSRFPTPPTVPRQAETVIRPKSAPWTGVSSSSTVWPSLTEHSLSSDPVVRAEEHIKMEPVSPRVMPTGSSVFVFPPPPVIQQEYYSHSSPHYIHALRTQASPLPSPVTSSMMERFAWLQTTSSGERLSDAEQTLLQHRESRHHAHSLPGSNQTANVPRSNAAVAPTIQMMHFVHGSAAESGHASTIENPARAVSQSSCPEFSPGAHAFRLPKKVHSASQSDEQKRWREVPSFVCPVCSVTFLSYRSLADHMALHVARPSSPSEAAGKEPEAAALASKSVHLCPVCQRTFSRGDMLTRHVRLHTGVRPYECTLCSQVFSRSDHLTTHQRTHTGEKPYRCPICSYAAPRRDMVTRHARIHDTAAGGSGTSGRRGRRTVSVGGPAVTADAQPVHQRVDPLQAEPAVYLPNPHRRHRSESGFGGRQHWSRSVGASDEDRPVVPFEPRQWSLASSTESAEGSASTPPATQPVTCRAWSTTSAESYESYPGASAARSSVSSSANADSPDVFSLQLRHFRWGAEAPTTEGSVTALEDSPASVDVACVTPAFQKCSVASPLSHDQDSDASDVS